jgi:predicted nucleotidyltransferase component of viral defense system
MSIIEQMLSKYNIESETDVVNALKEIFQEVALLGLYRGNFFSKAAFYGGTALRVLYGSNRFSEDLDFSLLKKDASFNIEYYFQYIINEFEAFGIDIAIKKKQKKINTDIESAFLKNNTSLHTLDINIDRLKSIIETVYSGKQLKIKLEVDVNPPLKFQTEAKTLLMPVAFNVVSMTLPNLYAGKMHAVLCRSWKNRVKGRDWYDFEWYVKQNARLNLEHLQERVYESGHLERDVKLDDSVFKQKLKAKIDNLNIEKAKAEVRPFLKDPSEIEFWSKDYFRLLADKVLFV